MKPEIRKSPQLSSRKTKRREQTVTVTGVKNTESQNIRRHNTEQNHHPEDLSTGTVNYVSVPSNSSSNDTPHDSQSSPKQTVRRKIAYKYSESNTEYSDQESLLDEPEFEMPRLKRLRSEAKEDQIWEGFPQTFRFKRLTPQQYQDANPDVDPYTAGDKTYISCETDKQGSSLIPSGKTLKQDILQIDNNTFEPTPSQSRQVGNIFSDFSKVVLNNGSPSTKVYQNHNFDTGDCTLNSKIKHENITPKRSARLRLKSESPDVKKDDGFVYTPLKRTRLRNNSSEKSKDKLKMNPRILQSDANNDISSSGENKCHDASTKNVDNENKLLPDNEVLKQLYKKSVAKEHYEAKVVNTIGSNKVHNSVQNLPQPQSIKSPTDHLPDRCPLETIETANTRICPVVKEHERCVEIHAADNLKQTKGQSHRIQSCITSSTEKSENIHDERRVCVFEPKELGTEQINSPQMSSESTNTDIEKKPLDYQNMPSTSKQAKKQVPGLNRQSQKRKLKGIECMTVRKTRDQPAIKLRIRKKGTGAEIIQSDATEDHAYVLSKPKSKIQKSLTTHDLHNVRSNNKRVLHKNDNKMVKRRSNRVANNSLVGKGSGVTEQVVDDMNSQSTSKNSPSSSCFPTTRQGQNLRKSVSEDDRLLKNSRVGQYACILWSSEHRRHFQQLHPDSTTEEIDDLMRTAWETLEKKTKLRYITRASDATRDENKHSTLTIVNTESNKETEKSNKGTEESAPSSSMMKFLSKSSEEQDIELKRWLKLFYEVSPYEYVKLKTNPKMRKEELKCKDNKDDHFQYYRKILYQSILDSKSRIIDMYEHKKQKQQDKVKESFGIIVKRLITGNSADVIFSRDSASNRLAEVLLDLKELENEQMVDVSGIPLTSKSYESVVDDLKKDNKTTDTETECTTIETSDTQNADISVLDWDDESENEFSRELLHSVADTDLPVLEVDSVIEILENPKEYENEFMFSNEIFKQLSSIFENHAIKEIKQYSDESETLEIRNPANILNNWVIADQFNEIANSKNPRLYNPMYSLIDRKKILPFLHNVDHCKDRKRDSTEPNKSDASNNNSTKPKHERERYQTKIDRLNQRSPLVATKTVPSICMNEYTVLSRSQTPQIRPSLQIASTPGISSSTGHTIVKYTSQPGRCRVFSVRQAK